MSWDIGNMQNIWPMIQQMLGQLTAGNVKPSYNEPNNTSGAVGAMRAKDASNYALQGDATNKSFLASILPQLLGPMLQGEQYKQQLDYEKKRGAMLNPHSGPMGVNMPGQNPSGNPLFNAEASGIGIQSPTQGMWGMGSQGWGGTPLSHQQEGAFDWGRKMQGWREQRSGSGNNKRFDIGSLWKSIFGGEV